MGDTVTEILPTQRLGLDEIYYQKVPVTLDKAPTGNEVPIPFGKLFGARSGDKGGCANCGVWAKTDAAYSFLFEYLSVAQLKKLLPDLAEYDIERYEIPNLKALNFYIHDILKDGVSSNNRIDGQAKTLCEYLRAKTIEVPKVLISSS